MSDFVEFLSASFGLFIPSKKREIASSIRNDMESPHDMLGILVLFLSILIGNILLFFPLWFSFPFLSSFSILILLGIIFGSSIIMLIFSLFNFVVSHLFVKLFGGDKSLGFTISVFNFLYSGFYITLSFFSLISILFFSISSIVSLLMGIVFFIFNIYFLIVLISTFSITHNMSKLKVFLAGLTYMFVAIILPIIIMIITGVASLFSLFSTL